MSRKMIKGQVKDFLTFSDILFKDQLDKLNKGNAWTVSVEQAWKFLEIFDQRGTKFQNVSIAYKNFPCFGVKENHANEQIIISIPKEKQVIFTQLSATSSFSIKEEHVQQIVMMYDVDLYEYFSFEVFYNNGTRTEIVFNAYQE